MLNIKEAHERVSDLVTELDNLAKEEPSDERSKKIDETKKELLDLISFIV